MARRRQQFNGTLSTDPAVSSGAGSRSSDQQGGNGDDASTIASSTATTTTAARGGMHGNVKSTVNTRMTNDPLHTTDPDLGSKANSGRGQNQNHQKNRAHHPDNTRAPSRPTRERAPGTTAAATTGTTTTGPTAIVLEKKKGVKAGTETRAYYPPGLATGDVNADADADVVGTAGDVAKSMDNLGLDDQTDHDEAHDHDDDDDEDNDDEDEDEEACFICAEKVKYYSGGICGHKTCQ